MQECVLSQQLVNLSCSKSLHVVCHTLFVHCPISYLLVPLSEHVSQWYCLNISVTFQVSHYVDMLLSRIMSENAMLPIPLLPFVVIELVASELQPFEVAIAGN